MVYWATSFHLRIWKHYHPLCLFFTIISHPRERDVQPRSKRWCCLCTRGQKVSPSPNWRLTSRRWILDMDLLLKPSHHLLGLPLHQLEWGFSTILFHSQIVGGELFPTTVSIVGGDLFPGGFRARVCARPSGTDGGPSGHRKRCPGKDPYQA